MVLSPSRRQVSVHVVKKLKRRWGHRKENRAMACVYTRGDAKQLPVAYVAKAFDSKILMDF